MEGRESAVPGCFLSGPSGRRSLVIALEVSQPESVAALGDT